MPCDPRRTRRSRFVAAAAVFTLICVPAASGKKSDEKHGNGNGHALGHIKNQGTGGVPGDVTPPRPAAPVPPAGNGHGNGHAWGHVKNHGNKASGTQAPPAPPAKPATPPAPQPATGAPPAPGASAPPQAPRTTPRQHRGRPAHRRRSRTDVPQRRNRPAPAARRSATPVFATPAVAGPPVALATRPDRTDRAQKHARPPDRA